MECAICLETIDEISGHLRLPCSHVFHIECAGRWLRSNHTCPCCRREYHAGTENSEQLIRRRINAIDYNEYLSETLHSIAQHSTLFEPPREMWNMLDADSQGQQLRLWLVEHMQRIFEREFMMILRDQYLRDGADEVADANPCDSECTVFGGVVHGVCCLLIVHVYAICFYLWTYVNG